MNQYYNSYFKVDMDQVIRNFNKVQNYIANTQSATEGTISAEPEIDTPSAILMEASTGQIIYCLLYTSRCV